MTNGVIMFDKSAMGRRTSEILGLHGGDAGAGGAKLGMTARAWTAQDMLTKHVGMVAGGKAIPASASLTILTVSMRCRVTRRHAQCGPV